MRYFMQMNMLEDLINQATTTRQVSVSGFCGNPPRIAFFPPKKDSTIQFIDRSRMPPVARIIVFIYMYFVSYFK